MSTSSHSPRRSLHSIPEPVSALSSREVRRVFTQSRSLRRHLRRLSTLPLSSEEKAAVAILLAAHVLAVRRTVLALQGKG